VPFGGFGLGRLFARIVGLDRQGEPAGGSVVDENAMLEKIATDQHEQPLGGERSADRARRIDRNRETHDLDLDGIDVLMAYPFDESRRDWREWSG
jgi:hypothetical protein